MSDARTSAAWLAPLVLVAAAIRIAVNDVVAFSRADESFYLLYTRTLVSGGGYPAIVRMFIDDRGMWVFPNPLRWAYLGASALSCSAAGECTHHSLAILSTVAGIAVVVLIWWIGRELFGPTVAWIAGALTATSPLQLALGRRALADEFFCAAVLASVAALLLCTREARPRMLPSVAWIAATTIAIASKEQFLFVYPVVLSFWWLRTRTLGRRELAIWALPPLLFAVVFSILARDVTSFFRIARIVTSVMTAPYAEQFQSGPPHRLILDSLAIAPIVTILALAAIVSVALRWKAFAAGHRHLVVLVVGILAVHAFVPSQNLRYIVAADPLLRLLGAAFLVTELGGKRWMPAALVATVAINTAVELKLFYDVFVVAQVYDPVTDNLLRAMRMLPRP